MLLKKWTQRILTFGLVTSMTSSVWAQNNVKVSLQEAIQTALNNNPRTQANSLRLQAAFDQLAAAKQSAYLPTASVGYSQSLQDAQNRNLQFSINLNLFRGFADYYSLKARECNYKKMEAAYNSTNAMLQNTSGQIVGLVANGYVRLINLRENILFYRSTLQRLNQLLPFAKTEEQRTNIENYINSITISLQESESSLKIAESNYVFVVNNPVPQSTDTLSETIQKIDIPMSSEESFQISLQKSPEILSAQLMLECLQLSHKAEKSQLYSPSVDLRMSRSNDLNGNSSNSAMVTISIPFSVGRITSHTANEKNITAAQLDLDGTIAEVKNDLSNTYIKLQSSQQVSESYSKQYQSNEIKIAQYLSKLNQLNAEEVNILYNLLGSQQGQWLMMNMKKQEVIDLRFNIQRNIGTLFETNRLFIGIN